MNLKKKITTITGTGILWLVPFVISFNAGAIDQPKTPPQKEVKNPTLTIKVDEEKQTRNNLQSAANIFYNKVLKCDDTENKDPYKYCKIDGKDNIPGTKHIQKNEINFTNIKLFFKELKTFLPHKEKLNNENKERAAIEEKLKNQIEEIEKKLNAISSLEKILFNKEDEILNIAKFKDKKDKDYFTFLKNNYTGLGYSKLKGRPEINYVDGILTSNEDKQYINDLKNNNPLYLGSSYTPDVLKKWEKYLIVLNKVADNNINNMKNFINQKRQECKCDKKYNWFEKDFNIEAYKNNKLNKIPGKNLRQQVEECQNSCSEIPEEWKELKIDEACQIYLDSEISKTNTTIINTFIQQHTYGKEFNLDKFNVLYKGASCKEYCSKKEKCDLNCDNEIDTDISKDMLKSAKKVIYYCYKGYKSNKRLIIPGTNKCKHLGNANYYLNIIFKAYTGGQDLLCNNACSIIQKEDPSIKLDEKICNYYMNKGVD